MGNYLPSSKQPDNKKLNKPPASNMKQPSNLYNDVGQYQQNYIQQNVKSNMSKQQQQDINYERSLFSVKRLRILNDKPEDKDKKIVAVIITFCSCSSYDNLFTTVQQKSIQGTRVEVYSCDSSDLQQVIEAFDGKSTSQVGKRLTKSLGEVDPDCVVLNWECSSGYSSKQFGEGADKLFKFVKRVLDRGHMTMFSDFSLKALVNEWQEKYGLGPNPFVQTSQHTGNFVIKFNAGDLKQCPSAQLQIIGDMTQSGTCNVNAAGGTIVYCVDQTKLKHNVYKLQVLTVVTNLHPPKEKLISKIGEHQGTAGHILLTYPSGGMILTSMGHWIELMQIDTSAKKIFEVAERQYGVEQALRMKQEYQAMDYSRQMDYISSNAREFVKNQAPCQNMSKKSRNY